MYSLSDGRRRPLHYAWVVIRPVIFFLFYLCLNHIVFLKKMSQLGVFAMNVEFVCLYGMNSGLSMYGYV